MKQLYFSFILVLSFFSCQTDLTPSWLEIKEVTLTTNEAIEGANSHDIVDAWVYIDNKEMGVWEIPFRMPVLEEGEHSLLIVPGIKAAGETTKRVTYSFYESFTTTINLKKEETILVTPNFQYKSATNITAKEDFEDIGVLLNPNLSIDTTRFEIIKKTDFPNIVKYGNNCGKLTLTKADSVLRVVTELNLEVVQDQMYLEIDYLSNNNFFIGIIDENEAGVQSDQGPIATVFRTDEDEFEWGKIYIPLSQRTNLNSFTDFFEFYIFADLDNENTIGEIYIDNIKIVYF